jgi:hypothetical protein
VRQHGGVGLGVWQVVGPGQDVAELVVHFRTRRRRTLRAAAPGAHEQVDAMFGGRGPGLFGRHMRGGVVVMQPDVDAAVTSASLRPPAWRRWP